MEANPAFRTRFFVKTKRAQTIDAIGAKRINSQIASLKGIEYLVNLCNDTKRQTIVLALLNTPLLYGVVFLFIKNLKVGAKILA